MALGSLALYDAVGHTLALHRPTTFLTYTGLGQLTKLFDAVAAERPDLLEWRGAVDEIERLRTAWITRAVSEWPVGSKDRPQLFLDCLSIIQSLTTQASVGAAEALLTPMVIADASNARTLLTAQDGHATL